MNRRILTVLGIVLVVLGILASSALFTVQQTEQALVLQFGDPKRLIQKPGLKFKMPFLQNVVYFDRRVLDFDPPAEEVIAADQKRLVINVISRFRIVDPLRFYQSVGNEAVVRGRLTATISASLRRVIGSVTLSSVLSEEREKIMNTVRDQVNVEAAQFGIDIIDVRIRRTDLPEENSQAIYARMQSEREREAREFRAQGAELAARIRSRADRERVVILAEAQKQSQILRGHGDGESWRIYADAYTRDSEFYRFYRSMLSYRTALDGTDTTFVLSPESDFFRYFNDSAGGASGLGEK